MKRKFSNLLVGCLVLCGVLSTVSAQAQSSDFIDIHINSGNPAFPFPQFLEYKEGKSLAKYNAEGVTHADMEKTMREAYEIMSHRARYTGTVVGGVPIFRLIQVRLKVRMSPLLLNVQREMAIFYWRLRYMLINLLSTGFGC